MPKEFTLSDIQNLYESVLGITLDKRNFRKKLLAMNLLIDTGYFQDSVAHRPARLYRFDKTKYQHLIQKGFSFEL
jgi:8-oxo-dGTP diphosphatase